MKAAEHYREGQRLLKEYDGLQYGPEGREVLSAARTHFAAAQVGATLAAAALVVNGIYGDSDEMDLYAGAVEGRVLP